MHTSHVPPHYCRKEEAISFAKGAWQRSLRTPVTVCLLQMLKKLRTRFEKQIIKIVKLLTLNAGSSQKNKANCLKLGDFLHNCFRRTHLILT